MSLPSVDLVYGLLIILPILFIIYSLYSFATHWHDGIERQSTILSSRLLVKIILIILLACMSLFCAI